VALTVFTALNVSAVIAAVPTGLLLKRVRGNRSECVLHGEPRAAIAAPELNPVCRKPHSFRQLGSALDARRNRCTAEREVIAGFWISAPLHQMADDEVMRLSEAP